MFEHFITAQDFVYGTVLDELRRGDKQRHWMWFIFPQLGALGHSERAIRYGLADAGEAAAYAAHPILGSRLRECTRLVLAVEGRTAHEILGSPDDIKLRSSMTLFGRATGEALFGEVLGKYYGGEEDPLTVELVTRSPSRAP